MIASQVPYSAAGEQYFHRTIQEAIWRRPLFSTDRKGPNGI